MEVVGCDSFAIYGNMTIAVLNGQCIGIEAMQFRWFHRQWNHNETRGLRGFTVNAVDSRRHTCSTWKTTKVYRRMEQWKQTYLCFNETFGKRRKLRVDLSKSVWYAVEQYSEGQSEMLARALTVDLHGDVLPSNHIRCSVANTYQRLAWLKVILLTFVHLNTCISSNNLWLVLMM